MNSSSIQPVEPAAQYSGMTPEDGMCEHFEHLPECATLSRGPWHTALRYARTLSYLKPVQIYSRFRPRPSPHSVLRTAQMSAVPGAWVKPIGRPPAEIAANRFRFLNEEREIATWNDAGVPKLWLYNLHYFSCADEALVRRWIEANPVGQGVGWDPYPTSLRICNWLKWILTERIEAWSGIRDSIATQAAWLMASIETHLLANHLLANAKALMFAGALLKCAESEKWYLRGLQLFQAELPRQILSDGAHVERSPMYHSIILEDLLDLCNLLHATHRPLPDITARVPPMLAWLEHMTHPDGEISLFNDATFGIAPEPATLQEYARRLGFEAASLPLSESGYVRLEGSENVLIFDAAPLGPDYQPGHGHADALSFELSHRSRRVLVNSGTSTYEMTDRRAFERGTAAHNTVRIDGVDQSEMWAAFRVARRAHCFDVRTDHQSYVEAAHDGYQRLHHGVVHRRRIDLAASSLTITDTLEGTGFHKAELFLHLAPCAEPMVQLDPKMSGSTVYSSYATGWNLLVPNRVVVGRWEGLCPAEFVTRVCLDG